MCLFDRLNVFMLFLFLLLFYSLSKTAMKSVVEKKKRTHSQQATHFSPKPALRLKRMFIREHKVCTTISSEPLKIASLPSSGPLRIRVERGS